MNVDEYLDDLPPRLKDAKRHAVPPTRELVEGVFKEDSFHQKDEERIVLEPIPERQLTDAEGKPEERISGVLNFMENGWDDIHKHAQMVKIWQDCGTFVSVAKAKIDQSDDPKEIKELERQLEWAEHQHNVARQWLEKAELYKTVRQ